MTHRLTLRTAALLTVPPLLWAGNAMVGRLLAGSVPPLLLNAMRWWAALLILLPLGWRALATHERRMQIRQRWRPLAALGLLGVGAYNALQYLALQTSTPINVTLIASSTPVWMLLVGALCHGEHPRPAQIGGALLSLAGVLLVLLRGEPSQLASLRLVAGDLWMLLAALSWALYSWQLARPAPALAGEQRPDWNWAEFILVQAVFGLFWASAAAGAEAVLAAPSHWRWTPTLVAALVFVAVGPSVLAYRCWGLGVAAVGPAMAGFFSNLTPLFAALLSAALLGQPPQPYHGLAFVLIVAGIWVSNRR
ncbi:MAG: DMT family transporter [Rubrivivax sp.]